MVDLIPQYYWHCETAESWQTVVEGSKGSTYIVSWNSHKHRNPLVQYDYSCTCKAYEFGNGTSCKHIKQVSSVRCGWSQFVDGGDAVRKEEERACPECGKQVHSMGWGV